MSSPLFAASSRRGFVVLTPCLLCAAGVRVGYRSLWRREDRYTPGHWYSGRGQVRSQATTGVRGDASAGDRRVAGALQLVPPFLAGATRCPPRCFVSVSSCALRRCPQQLSHINIIKLLDVYEDAAEVHMVRARSPGIRSFRHLRAFTSPSHAHGPLGHLHTAADEVALLKTT